MNDYVFSLILFGAAGVGLGLGVIAGLFSGTASMMGVRRSPNYTWLFFFISIILFLIGLATYFGVEIS